MSELSKLALFLLRCIGHDDAWAAGLSRKNGMSDLIVRQGPEGRRLDVSPARKGWVLEGKPERRRCGTPVALNSAALLPNLVSPC